MTFHVAIPTMGDPLPLAIEAGTSTIFVGANGSGKTRLAVYIEESLGERAHRISAHRALILNPAVEKISEGGARRGLKFGARDEAAHVGYRFNHRWQQSKAATSLLNDFDFLLQVLFAEQSRTALQSHSLAHRSENFIAANTIFQQLEVVWEALLPERQLIFDGDDIRVRACGDGTTFGSSDLYSAADMSDGERAIFYLIGQVLVAEKDSVLIIDEPELHVHRSIMSKLWDQLESARKDCAFVFITHDLEFAASRVGTKFMIDAFSKAGPAWTISPVPEDTGFSEELTTLLLGSRHPVLFVEGERVSLDMAVYRVVYPGWTVVPRGSCQSVIHAVATFRANPTLTRIQCAGIIDADDYDGGEAAWFAEQGVFVLPVAEVENLFMLPSIALVIAKLDHRQGADAQGRVDQLRGEIVALLRRPGKIDEVVVRHVMRRIDRALKRVDVAEAQDVDALAALYKSKTEEVSVVDLAAERRDAIEAALAASDLEKLLALVDQKEMLNEAARRLKSTRLADFKSWITRALLTEEGQPLVQAIRSVLPEVVAG